MACQVKILQEAHITEAGFFRRNVSSSVFSYLFRNARSVPWRFIFLSASGFFCSRFVWCKWYFRSTSASMRFHKIVNSIQISSESGPDADHRNHWSVRVCGRPCFFVVIWACIRSSSYHLQKSLFCSSKRLLSYRIIRSVLYTLCLFNRSAVGNKANRRCAFLP